MATKTTTADATEAPESGGAGDWTEEERAAMKDRAQEARKTRSGKKADGTAELLAKVAELPDDDRELAEWIHGLVTAAAPDLAPRTYYGMPAYARNGKVLCFFQPASKFKVRYGTLGFETIATLDEGTMWPTSFAITEKNDANAARITELVKAATR